MQARQLSRFSMTSTQAAAYLDLSLGHLYNLLAEARGPRHVRYANQLRFCAEDLDAWVDSHCRVVETPGIADRDGP